jgi:two-component system LytT family sensor kinase
MTDAYVIAQTLGFATGSVLSLLLLPLVWKAERLAGQTQRGSWAVLLALCWNIGSLVRYAALLLGAESVARLANACAYSAAALLPAAGLLMLSPGWPRRWQHYASLGLRPLSFVTATGLTFGLFAAALRPGFPLRFQTLRQLTAYHFVCYLVAVLLLLRGASQVTHTARAFTRNLLFILSGLALGLLLTFHFALGPAAIGAIETFTQQATIPLAIAAFAFLAQFHFADVFVKRSLTILAAVLVVVVYSIFIVAPLTQAVRAVAPRAEAAAWVTATLLWCGLLLLFPSGERAIYQAADRWLFRRPDYQQLANAFARKIESAANEDELLALVAQDIQCALGASAVRVIPRAELSARGDEFDLPPLAPNEALKLPADHPACLAARPGEPEIEVLLPIAVNSQVTHLLLLATGARGRTLLSDEMAFLSTLAERAGRRLETLHFERERREQQLREARWQHLLTEAELKALRAQVNPHFLFNTLNTIADLIGAEPEKAEAMTERLAEVFRYVLARSEGHLISVREEFDFLRTYLEIEQARFGEWLQVEMMMDASVAAALIPPLILQPLVENAIKHGLAPKFAGGSLRIRALDEAACLRLTVEDDGVGWRASDPPISSGLPHGVGLRNVTERLQMLYGARASLTIHSRAEEGARISITIPKDETQDLDHRRRSFCPVAAAETARRAS